MQKIETIRREDFDIDLSWLAGFIDGEGCFYLGFNMTQDRGFSRKTMRTTILISNTSPYCMGKVTKVLCDNGVGFSNILIRPKTNKKWSNSLQLKISGHKRTEKLSKLLLPYLTCKREQAKQLIYAIEYRKYLAEKFGGNNKNSRLVDNPILQLMADRMKDLNADRPSLFKYSLKASQQMYIKKPSETTRLAAISYENCKTTLNADDIVRAV